MKLLMIKLATILSGLALAAAHTSTTACFYFVLGESKMPKSLYVRD